MLRIGALRPHVVAHSPRFLAVSSFPTAQRAVSAVDVSVGPQSYP